MLNLLKSRKFKLTLAAILGVVTTALTGEITWHQAIPLIIGALCTNVLGIAIEDHGAKAGTK